MRVFSRFLYSQIVHSRPVCNIKNQTLALDQKKECELRVEIEDGRIRCRHSEVEVEDREWRISDLGKVLARFIRVSLVEISNHLLSVTEVG